MVDEVAEVVKGLLLQLAVDTPRGYAGSGCERGGGS